ncbi:MAG: hypothetical protein N3A69_13405, partial [Leptospiraceae bacterium]|nr:hypothetical protein [Leptospiraceae bacterium]
MIPHAVDPYSNTKQLVDLTNNSIGSETSRILKSKVFKVVSGSLVIMGVSAWALHKFLNMKNKKVVVLSKPGFIFNTEQ